MIRILLADDHPVVREGLRGIIDAAEGLQVAGLAATGAAAVELADRLHPDVVLMDLSMPVIDGVEATRRIVAAGNGVHVLALTSFADPDRVIEALDAGAVGYLLKDTDSHNLVAAIRAVVRGESPIDPRVARTLLSRQSRPSTPDLTGRERDVLLLVSQGMANKQVARSLGIAERTVKAHLTSAFHRIGVSDRTSAALWAHRHLVAEA